MTNNKMTVAQRTMFEERKSIESFTTYKRVKIQTTLGPIQLSKSNLLTKARAKTVVVITM